jgi:hypothetical protein
MASKNGTTVEIEPNKSMAGVLAILIADREERMGADPRKTEVILADAGLSHGDIAAVTGKQYAAVRMAVNRSRKPKKRKKAKK